MWDKIAAHISDVTVEKFHINNRRSVSGGCINQGYAISSNNRTYFIKLNRATDLAMFEAEAQGVQQMWDTHTIRVPRPICWGTEGDSAYLVLEWLDLGGRGGERASEEMGRKLAAMHRWNPPDGYPAHPAIGEFGWEINNTIGSTTQINTWTANWAEFWTKHRIGYQLKLAKRRGGQFSQGERLLEVIPELLAGYQPKPSLVHGDLWGGNASCTSAGEPVIFDPATYFGDREVDIAMTELFGGFPAAFYRGYNEVWPLDAGYSQRKTLYNLYHVLNHFNLFGGSYESQANRMIQQLLSS
ncbi:fructosamine kinase family protein [Microcoleus sp. FACHB-68]|uniref:fructosamine kinase family protein n=1 Tax=Microcoleus sp. FACHB-68 TaxID=2692826 RepID=UPI001684D16E|nr:fructosamine kinase family protein [Microcoleus sp. FACHB-68]MBD1936194.1 fructosamine kinase family protein [Microcoleus sp. FACHB-68]